ncbi:hypothetical protein NC653_001220 [Populus alba x Populus x berolinensis]|uniref:Wax synthase domain-containing protein n=1 Tax=Populus alba x Populus x berolinensis TaxID=444605 RepID=A0AAD6RKH7_9ROSI|nr:hypothetical protein NC653_001220 [Populus alba x Populus x berolinensis]
MEGEIKNFIMVWASALLLLWYCHIVGKIISKGVIRFFAILPVILFLFFLPLNLFTIWLGGPTSFFLSWLANFKLLLFAFGQGPLSTSPVPLSFPYFISLACLPIKFQQVPQKSGHKSPLNHGLKIVVLAITAPIYLQKDHVHPKMVMLLYCVYLYIGLELVLAVVAAFARAGLRLELEPQFHEPYLATSLQDFWGRRWNLMVTSILHPTVYNPVMSISSRLIGRKWAALPGVLASFLVSGIMHEIIFYNIGRKKPTWELTCFFFLHGISLAIEIVIKKAFNGKWQPATVVSRLLTLAFVVVTAMWLFMPPVLYAEFDVMTRRECIAFVNFVKDIITTDSRFKSFITVTEG